MIGVCPHVFYAIARPSPLRQEIPHVRRGRVCPRSRQPAYAREYPVLGSGRLAYVESLCEHVFVRWQNLQIDGGEQQPAGISRSCIRAPLQSAGGTRCPLLRGSGQIGAQPRARGVANAVPLDGQSLQGLHARLLLLLRAPDAHLPRLRCRPRLRARDRGQGQRARGAARRARPSLVEGRARGARHEHRPLPMGREPLSPHP